LVGYNESEKHKRYKQKVANVLRSFNYTVFGDNGDDEVSIRRDGLSPPYYIDVCGCNDKRILVVEIDGYRGHKTRYAICKDKTRLEFIKEKLGKNCQVYRFAFWQLKNTSDDLIAEELGLIGR
jgi:very-short-patch-repair endonuclease